MTDRIILGAFAVGAVIAVAVFAFLAFNLVSTLGDNQERIDSFQRQCVERSGHTYGTGLLLCLDSEGRVIEVYP